MAVMLGASGCGPGQQGEVPAAPSEPPEDSGPFTKDRVRTDLDTSAADAGAPPTDPDWAEMAANAPAGSKRACWVEYRGYGTDADPIELSQYEAAADELRERGWQQAKADDATPGQARSLLKKRGWTLVAEFRDTRGVGQLNLMAFEDACVKRYGGGASANPGAGPLG